MAVLVTVTQYQGPTMQFESIRGYAEWLWNGGKVDPDHAVDLHEDWGMAFTREIVNNHKELERLFDQFEHQRDAAYTANVSEWLTDNTHHETWHRITERPGWYRNVTQDDCDMTYNLIKSTYGIAEEH